VRAIKDGLEKFKFDVHLPQVSGNKYMGEVVNKKKACYLPDGALYKGFWCTTNGEEMRHGQGEQIQADGSFYEGYWKNDQANGHGRMIHVDGAIYDGQWKEGKAHGYGVNTDPDGFQYSGDWTNDK
jgi:hypothetical protein